ncbi:Map microtubule affinity-regulating kinase [Chytriomyces hyalinus]|nr:Map microtubule affinity-regulating kinase [Chytriomyces hyalinus]
MSATVAPVSVAETQSSAQGAPVAAGHAEKQEEKHKHVGNYEILKTVGEGSFAKVKLAIHRLTKQKVALKIIDKEKLPDEYSLKNIHREAQIMRLLDHPHIIQLYEVMETKKELFLVLEYAVGGELLDYIVARGRLHEKEARKFFHQIVSALEYCHTLNIVHRDLKAENLLLDENSQIKISDFGLSNVFDRSKNLVTCCGSPVYSAPELIEGRKYTGPEVDCWSLGINLYAMVIGDLPFADSNLTALYNSILKGSYHVPDFVSTECKDLISKLLERNPEKRWNITQVRDHPWLTHGNTMLEPRGSVTAKINQRTRPKTEADLDGEILEQLLQMGFEKGTAINSVVGGKFNQAAGTYYLMAAQKKAEADKRSKQVAKELQMQQKAVAANANKGRNPPSSDFDALKFQVQDERQKVKPQGEQIGADIIHEFDRRRSQTSDPRNTTSRGQLGVPKPPPQHTTNKSQNGVLPASLIQAGLVPLSSKANSKSIEISSALAQQQAACLVPSTPPESKAAALVAGPLTDMLYAAHDQYKGKSGQIVIHNALPSDASAMSLQSKSPRKRDASVKPSIPIDYSLYLDPLQDEDAKDPSFPEIRTIRFAFNCQTTTAVTPDIMIARLKKVLGQNDVTWRFDSYLAECEWGDIKFEVEICKLPRMKAYGLRLKRNAGDMWDYKRLSGKICAELEL